MSEEMETMYPCYECGKLRTKAEGGTTFTVCDECWDKRHPPTPPAAEPAGAPGGEVERAVGELAEARRAIADRGIMEVDCSLPLAARIDNIICEMKDWRFMFGIAATECDRLREVLKAYADLGGDDIPYADTINDPPDVGRAAREALNKPQRPWEKDMEAKAAEARAAAAPATRGGETEVEHMKIGQLVTWREDGGRLWSGNVVGFDTDAVAVCFAEEVREGGNVRHPNPVVFVQRRMISAAAAVAGGGDE